jgi:HEAT repeat protein
MTMARTFAATLLLILAAALAGAQSASTTGKELTIEEKFLLKSIELQILREQAFAPEYDSKMLALDALSDKINRGASGSDADDLEFILEYLSMEGTSHTVREGLRLANYYPDVRRRATELLGKVRTEQSKNALITVLLNDDEPMVKAQAAYSLGELGMNEDNEVVAALVFAVDREDHTRADNNWGYAMALAFEKLHQKTGGLKYPGAFRALVKISQGNYLATVRQKALQVLEAMKK